MRFSLTNFESHSKPFGGLSTKEFIEYLSKNGKSDVKELDTDTYLSRLDTLAKSKLIVFGAKNVENKKARYFAKITFVLFAKINNVSEKLKNYLIGNLF
jgi:hypothetical protein